LGEGELSNGAVALGTWFFTTITYLIGWSIGKASGSASSEENKPEKKDAPMITGL
jgi:hypothetical protein